MRPISEYAHTILQTIAAHQHCRYLVSNQTVKISVGSGDQKKTWPTLSEDLLCDHSAYFRAAFQGGFMESWSKSLDFPEDFIYPTAFGRLIDWMYGQELKCNESHDPREHHSTHGMLWCSLYVVTDRLSMSQVAEETLKVYSNCLEAGDWLPNREEIRFVYQNTMAGSPLRHVIRDRFLSFFLAASKLGEGQDSIWSRTVTSHGSFHIDVLAALARHSKSEVCGLRECTVHWPRPGCTGTRKRGCESEAGDELRPCHRCRLFEN